MEEKMETRENSITSKDSTEPLQAVTAEVSIEARENPFNIKSPERTAEMLNRDIVMAELAMERKMSKIGVRTKEEKEFLRTLIAIAIALFILLVIQKSNIIPDPTAEMLKRNATYAKSGFLFNTDGVKPAKESKFMRAAW